MPRRHPRRWRLRLMVWSTRCACNVVRKFFSQMLHDASAYVYSSCLERAAAQTSEYDVLTCLMQMRGNRIMPAHNSDSIQEKLERAAQGGQMIHGYVIQCKALCG